MSSNNNSNAGINVNSIDNLIIEVNNYTETIKRILNDFDDIVQENMQYFICDSKEKFLIIHNENKYNYSIFEKNILSYANDLLNVKKKWQDIVEDVSTNLIDHNN